MEDESSFPHSEDYLPPQEQESAPPLPQEEQDETPTHVHIQLGDFKVDDNDDFFIDMNTNKIYKFDLPANYTGEQIMEHVKENVTVGEEKLAKVMEKMKTPFITLTMHTNDPADRDIINQYPLGKCLKLDHQGTSDHSHPILYCVAYDKDIEEAASRRKEDRINTTIKLIDEVLVLSVTPDAVDDVYKVFTFSYQYDCPYNYGNFKDKDVVENGASAWAEKLKKIHSNIETWAEQEIAHKDKLLFLFTSPEHLKRMVSTRVKYGETLAGRIFSNKTFTDHKIFNSILPFPDQLKIFSELVRVLNGETEGEKHSLPMQWLEQIIVGVDSKYLTELFPPELVDSLLFLSEKKPLPDILPDTNQICQMTEDEIEEKIATYVGKPVAQLTKMLRPGGYSKSGFMGENDRLGSIIKNDAELLKRLELSREELAERTQQIVFDKTFESKGLPFAVFSIEHNVFQEDPFHPSCGNPSIVASVDYIIYPLGEDSATNAKEDESPSEKATRLMASGNALRFGRLHPGFIKRLCFFGGGSFRVDPELAIKFLLETKTAPQTQTK